VSSNGMEAACGTEYQLIDCICVFADVTTRKACWIEAADMAKIVGQFRGDPHRREYNPVQQ